MYKVNVWKLNRPGVPEKDCINWYGETEDHDALHKKLGDEYQYSYMMPTTLKEAHELLQEHTEKGLVTICQSPFGAFDPFVVTGSSTENPADIIEFRIIPRDDYVRQTNAIMRQNVLKANRKNRSGAYIGQTCSDCGKSMKSYENYYWFEKRFICEDCLLKAHDLEAAIN